MIERQNSGFLEWHEADMLRKDRPGLGAESSQLQACIRHFQETGMSGWFGCPGFGFHEQNLDFLKSTPTADWLWFWDISLNDISAIYDLPNLNYLGIHPDRPGIDYGRLPQLQLAVSFWNRKDTGLNAAEIHQFDLWHYKPKFKQFVTDCVPERVSLLRLYWANPESLSGLPIMPNVTRIEIYRCRNLIHLDALTEIAPNLYSLGISQSGKVQADSVIRNHPTLKFAYINGKGFTSQS